jgi:hypothetical protein
VLRDRLFLRTFRQTDVRTSTCSSISHSLDIDCEHYEDIIHFDYWHGMDDINDLLHALTGKTSISSPPDVSRTHLLVADTSCKPGVYSSIIDLSSKVNETGSDFGRFRSAVVALIRFPINLCEFGAHPIRCCCRVFVLISTSCNDRYWRKTTIYGVFAGETTLRRAQAIFNRIVTHSYCLSVSELTMTRGESERQEARLSPQREIYQLAWQREEREIRRRTFGCTLVEKIIIYYQFSFSVLS